MPHAGGELAGAGGFDFLLGCAKNLVDAEIMLGSLLKSGVEITNDAAQADVVIVNTCSFIDSAQEESVDTILESAEVREANNRGQGINCFRLPPPAFSRGVAETPSGGVDAFMGIDQVAQVSEIRKTSDDTPGGKGPKFKTGGFKPAKQRSSRA